jgi:hypothetical protein
VGWVPLAPYEAFRPWYGRGITNVNVVNNVNIVNNYRNARFVNGVNGVTSMQAGQFGRGAVNSGNFVRASQADLRGAGSIQGRMPVTPAATSNRLSDRAVNTAGMPAANANQRFAGRSNFAGSNPGSTGATPSGSPRAFNGAVSNAGASNNGASNAGASNNGWTRMTPRGSTPAGGQGSVAQGSGAGAGGQATANRGAGYATNGGWRSFNPGAGGNNQTSAPGSNGNPAAPRGGNATPTAPNGSNGSGYRGGAPGASSTPQTRGFTPQQQPVRISPPIVSNRGASGAGPAARPDVHSGFGGAHSGGGGGGNRGGGGGGGGHRGR